MVGPGFEHGLSLATLRWGDAGMSNRENFPRYRHRNPETSHDTPLDLKPPQLQAEDSS